MGRHQPSPGVQGGGACVLGGLPHAVPEAGEDLCVVFGFRGGLL